MDAAPARVKGRAGIAAKPLLGTLQGHLRIAEGAFVDDAGPALPVFCHYGTLFALYLRRPDLARAILDTIAAAGYHGVRFWTTLGGPYWDSHGLATRAEDNLRAFEDFLGELWRRGLRGMISQGDVGHIRNRRAWMRMLSEAVYAVDPAVAAFVDTSNEGWQTGEPDPAKLADMASAYREAGGAAVLTLTSPPGEEQAELNAYSIDPAQCFDVHGYRGGHWWDKLRHIRNVVAEHPPRRRLGVQSEWTGPGPFVSGTEHKHELDAAVMQAACLISLMHRQVWVYFAGVETYDTPLEAQPGFLETPRIAQTLPLGIMRWQAFAHGGPSQTKRVFEVTDGNGLKTMRCDHVIEHADGSGRFAVLAYGPNLREHRQVRGTVEEIHQIGDKAVLYLGHA